jgi:phosphate-selective porin OprO/OprP
MSRVVAALLVFVLVPPYAFAQGQPAAPPVVSAGPGGIVIESSDAAFRLQIGVLVHADGRFALGDEAGTHTDTFAVRRARPILRGRLARRFEFSLVPDLAGSTVTLGEAYVDAIVSPVFRLRAGKGKSPFGLERLQAASNILFYERAFPTAIAPNRDVGLTALGDIGRVSYAVAVSNGVVDGGLADIDTNDAKDVVGRIVVRVPRGVTVALAASAGRHQGATALPTFRTALLSQAFFSYSGAVADGVRRRYSPQLTVYRGPFGGIAEYIRSEGPIARASLGRRRVGHEAWQVAGSWVLTGENATDSALGIVPRAGFDPAAHAWGALQIAVRYHALRVDEEAAAAGVSRQADAWTVGLNWYLTQNFRYTFNFERTTFDRVPRPAEDAFAVRTQVSF